MAKRIPCQVYSRIVGYYRPTRDWNEGARRMFHDRVMFTMPREVREDEHNTARADDATVRR